MKRVLVLIITFLLMMNLVACGKKETIDQSNLEINKDGSITATLVDSFEEAYYDFEELCAMNASEVMDFNNKYGADKVVIDDSICENGQVKITMTYTDSATYATYHDVIFFVGTIADAYHQKYDLDVSLQNQDNETIGKKELLEMGSQNIVIMEESMPVITSGNMLYYSQGVSMEDKKFATVSSEDQAYIVFK